MKVFELILLGASFALLVKGHPFPAGFIALWGALVTLIDLFTAPKYADVDRDKWKEK